MNLHFQSKSVDLDMIFISTKKVDMAWASDGYSKYLSKVMNLSLTVKTFISIGFFFRLLIGNPPFSRRNGAVVNVFEMIAGPFIYPLTTFEKFVIS